MNTDDDIGTLDGRREELMAEAQAAVSTSANALRSIRERYRVAHLDQLRHWESLRDELAIVDRRKSDAAEGAALSSGPVRGNASGSGGEAPTAATATADAPATDATDAADLPGDEARVRRLRRDEAMSARQTGAEAAELARLELALQSLENTWLFLSRDDASLVGDPAGPVTTADLRMRIVEAQEAERTRLAREVHDGPAQALANATFQVEIVERMLARDPVLAAAELRLLRDLLRRELGDVRAFISQLRPPILADLGLAGAIRDTATQVAEVLGVPIEVSVDPDIEGLPDGVETVTLRIIQEALQNVRRHAHAGRVTITAAREGEDWLVEVRDDGRGFDVGAVAARGRRNFGLQFMRERAELVGARFEVRSQPDGGTAVRIAIPRGAEETE
jgi:two-component system, NarL family, sensor histidine kinase DegS